jgi:hypothetical protein
VVQVVVVMEIVVVTTVLPVLQTQVAEVAEVVMQHPDLIPKVGIRAGQVLLYLGLQIPIQQLVLQQEALQLLSLVDIAYTNSQALAQSPFKE